MPPVGHDGREQQRLTATKPTVDLAPVANGAAGASVDRRTLLIGAAGVLLLSGRGGPAGAAGRARSLGARPRRFDPGLARQLERVLHDAVRGPGMHAPGAILHADSPKLGAYTRAAGLACVSPPAPMRAADRFHAGSIVKMLVAARVLQLAERGHLPLDARLPAVLPARVTGRFPQAPDVTVRMLLGHRSGIPEWETPLIDIVIAHHPAKRWTIEEKLDLAAAQPPAFAPGTSYAYSNTEYNLLGLVIEHATGRSWRHEVTRRVIRPLDLGHTYLPTPGHRSIGGAHA